MLPAPTRIPEVVDRLIKLHKDATGLQVTDGAHIGEIADHAICVGFVLGNQAGYDARTERTGGMSRRVTEDFTVRCFLSLASGSTDMKGLRDQAGAYLGQISEAIQTHNVVDGVWDSVRFGDRAEWLPVQTPQGAVCSVLYSIEGSALL